MVMGLRFWRTFGPPELRYYAYSSLFNVTIAETIELLRDISIAEDLYCLKAVDRTLFEMEGTTRTHSSLCSWASVSEQIANNKFLTSSFGNISKTVPSV